ncbi:IclR family transcriptional regulator [Priestia filamentosa]|uniref:IclR family transcriptional regulator n=1 Tax=Priestia filamentosa TaxID=1402861 RepID=UPI000589423E
MPLEKENGGQGIRTVQRALDILACFDEKQPQLNLTQISEKIGLAKSTTTRLLSTLEQNGYVEKDLSTLKYKLGKQIYYLGHIAGKSIELKTIAKPIMEKLRDETKETINLHTLEGIYRVCIEQALGLNTISHSIKIGVKHPLWAGAGGKALLAFQNEEFIQMVLETAVNPRPQLMDELEEIKTVYFCSSIDEEEIGSSAVSAPIFDINGVVKASLSISGPTSRFSQENITNYQKIVKDAAFLISSKMGYVHQEKVL